MADQEPAFDRWLGEFSYTDEYDWRGLPQWNQDVVRIHVFLVACMNDYLTGAIESSLERINRLENALRAVGLEEFWRTIDHLIEVSKKAGAISQCPTSGYWGIDQELVLAAPSLMDRFERANGWIEANWKLIYQRLNEHAVRNGWTDDQQE